MFIRFFRGTGFGPLFILVVIALGLWMSFFINPPEVIQTHENIMPLWSSVLLSMSDSPTAAVGLSFILALLLVILIIRFNTSVFFISRRSYWPGVIYLLLFSVFPGQMILNPAQPAAILIILGMWRMMMAYRRNGVAYNFFDAAILISSAGLLYANAIWFTLFVLIGALLLRSPDIREISVVFLGALLPWAVFYGVWYLTGKDTAELSQQIYSCLFDEVPTVYCGRTLIILFFFIGLNFIPALYFLMANMSTQKVKSRKTFSMLNWMLFFSVVLFIALPSVSVEIVAIGLIPFSYIIANHYVFTRRIATSEILFITMTIMLIISRIWPY